MLSAINPGRRPVASLAVTGVLLILFAYGIGSAAGLALKWGATIGGLGVLAGWLALAALALPLIGRRPSRGELAGLAIVALALRAGSAAIVINRLPQGDAQSYLTLAASLRAGGGLAIAEPFMGLTTQALFPPAYPLLLAAWSAASGLSTPSLLALSTMTDLATAAVMSALMTRLGQAGAGRGAAWLYLIWPSALFSAPLAQKESLCALLVVILASAWTWEGGTRIVRSAIIGVAAGLLALTQPGEVPLAALFGVVLIRQLGAANLLRIGVPAAGIAGLVLLPWWIRNWLIFGAFVPLTTASGVGLWIGNNPDATGNWMPPPVEWRGVPELAYGRHASQVARAWIAAHPGQFVRLALTKLARSCGVGQFGLVRLSAMHPAPPSWVAALLFSLSHGAHVLMLGGAAAAARLRSDRATATIMALLVACGLQVGLFGVWFEFGERHREFATPFLLLLICLGFERLATRNQIRRVPG